MEHDDSRQFFFYLTLVVASGLAFGLLVAIVHARPSVATILIALAICAPLVAGLFAYAWYARRRA